MLGKLRPDSWLHKEVRRKIEEVFLRNDDRAGLVDLLRAVDQDATPRTSRPWCGWAGRWRRWAGWPRPSPGTRRRSSWLPAVATSGSP